jgi:hypothetical protein
MGRNMRKLLPKGIVLASPTFIYPLFVSTFNVAILRVTQVPACIEIKFLVINEENLALHKLIIKEAEA